MEQEIDLWINATSAVKQTLHWSVVVTRFEPKGKTLFFIRSLFLSSPMVTDWVETERMRLQETNGKWK